MVQQHVLLTGASGFLATHVLDTLVARGYAVTATVRSQAKGEHIAAKYASKPVTVAVVPDIGADGAFDKVLRDGSITAVIHTASPVIMQPKSDPVAEVLDPAINGVQNILQAVAQHAPQVSTVVLTSSALAIMQLQKFADPDFIHTEETWSDVGWDMAVANPNLAYYASKNLGERAAWKFLDDNKVNFSLTTINPPYIYGPVLQQVSSFEAINETSMHLWKVAFDTKPGDIKGTYNAVPTVYVDVRDVALAHVLPLENPKLAGKRLLPLPGMYTQQQVLDIVNREFPEARGKIAVGQPGTGEFTGRPAPAFDTSATDALLQIKYRPLEETIRDSFAQLFALKKKLGEGV